MCVCVCVCVERGGWLRNGIRENRDSLSKLTPSVLLPRQDPLPPPPPRCLSSTPPATHTHTPTHTHTHTLTHPTHWSSIQILKQIHRSRLCVNTATHPLFLEDF